MKLFENINDIEVGIDEAGRGCLIGKVCAAAAIMPKEFNDEEHKNIKDSKLLSEKKRKKLREYIENKAISFGIGWACEKEIDKHNIFNATQLAMHRALDNLNTKIDHIYIDGNKFKPYLDEDENYPKYTCIVKGDNHFFPIACASILAKCYRDEYIYELVKKDPDLETYSLSNNKGYGTLAHRQAIEKYGITKLHRKTFGICKNKEPSKKYCIKKNIKVELQDTKEQSEKLEKSEKY